MGYIGDFLFCSYKCASNSDLNANRSKNSSNIVIHIINLLNWVEMTEVRKSKMKGNKGKIFEH